MNIEYIDDLRGIAFILMFIYHIFIYLNICCNNNYLDNIFVNLIGHIARITFILLFGICLYLAYNKYKYNIKKYRKHYFTKIKYLLLSALFISCFTYLIIPDKFIYFGVLHFMCLSMILLYYFIDKTYLLIFLLLISLILKYKSNYYIYSQTNNIFYNILGFGYYRNTLDLFKLSKWLYLVIIGILIGKIIIYNNIFKTSKLIKKKNNSIIKYLGKNTLLLYTIHWPILYIIIKIICKNVIIY